MRCTGAEPERGGQDRGRGAHAPSRASASRSRSPKRPWTMAESVARPGVERAVPHQLEIVAVGIGQVDRLVRPVVGRLADRDPGRPDPAQRVRERGARRVADGDVMQPGHAVGLRRRRRRLPGVEAEVVVIAAGRDEQHVAGRAPARHITRLGHDLEAEHADVELAHAVDVGRAEVDVPDRHAGVDRPRRRGERFSWTLRAWLGHARTIAKRRGGRRRTRAAARRTRRAAARPRRPGGG